MNYFLNVCTRGCPFTGVFNVIIPLLLLYFLFRAYFRRDPERKIPQENDVIVSPADGRVDFIGKADTEFIKGMKRAQNILDGLQNKDYTLISIFMNVFDVHIQRMPISGKIVSVKHFPGKLLPVTTLKAGFLNERTETIISTAAGLLKVDQIAGIIARRIDNYLSVGNEYSTGRRLGMIHFGSRVNLLIASDSVREVKCKIGDKVKAGETVLAHI